MEIIEVLEPAQFEKLVVPICSRIARCVSSYSSQVRAGSTMAFFRMDNFVSNSVLEQLILG